MLEHLVWHAVHAAAPVEDKEAASHIVQGMARRPPWHAPYAQRPPPQAARHAAAPEDEREAPGAAPGAGGAARRGSIPAGLAPLAPLWAPLGAGSQHPMDPAHPGELAASADPAAMPIRDRLTQGGRGGQRPLAPLLEPVQRPGPTGMVPPGHTPTALGAGGLYR